MAEKRISLQQGIQSVFLQRDVQLFTTRCCINQLQQLVHKKQTKFIRGCHILRTLKLLPCKHGGGNNNKNDKSIKNQKQRWKCIDAIKCLQSYINNDETNKKTYCFALQPRAYLGRVRNKPGIPSIWMYESTMILDKLSKASQTFMQNNKHLRYHQNDDDDTNKDESQQEQDNDINGFMEEDEDEGDDKKMNYNVLEDLQLDDEQNEDDYGHQDFEHKKPQKKYKENRRKNVGDFKGHKQRKFKNKRGREKLKGNGRYTGQMRIHYDEGGGYGMTGLPMQRKRKTRSKRGRNKNKKKDNDGGHNLNDNSFERDDNENGMTISKSEKSMSSWWHKNKKVDRNGLNNGKDKKLNKDEMRFANKSEKKMNNWWKN